MVLQAKDNAIRSISNELEDFKTRYVQNTSIKMTSALHMTTDGTFSEPAHCTGELKRSTESLGCTTEHNSNAKSKAFNNCLDSPRRQSMDSAARNLPMLLNRIVSSSFHGAPTSDDVQIAPKLHESCILANDLTTSTIVVTPSKSSSSLSSNSSNEAVVSNKKNKLASEKLLRPIPAPRKKREKKNSTASSQGSEFCIDDSLSTSTTQLTTNNEIDIPVRTKGNQEQNIRDSSLHTSLRTSTPVRDKSPGRDGYVYVSSNSSISYYAPQHGQEQRSLGQDQAQHLHTLHALGIATQERDRFMESYHAYKTQNSFLHKQILEMSQASDLMKQRQERLK